MHEIREGEEEEIVSTTEGEGDKGGRGTERREWGRKGEGRGLGGGGFYLERKDLKYRSI